VYFFSGISVFCENWNFFRGAGGKKLPIFKNPEGWHGAPQRGAGATALAVRRPFLYIIDCRIVVEMPFF
jgi:hypothetical protein